MADEILRPGGEIGKLREQEIGRLLAVALGQYVVARAMPSPPGQKTLRWGIQAVRANHLGIAFMPEGLTVFSAGCLDDIRRFVVAQNAAHQQAVADRRWQARLARERDRATRGRDG